MGASGWGGRDMVVGEVPGLGAEGTFQLHRGPERQEWRAWELRGAGDRGQGRGTEVLFCAHGEVTAGQKPAAFPWPG